jgi:hypothetical protein
MGGSSDYGTVLSPYSQYFLPLFKTGNFTFKQEKKVKTYTHMKIDTERIHTGT